MKNIKEIKGFTLIELLVVIAIIGILSTVILGSLNSARGRGGDAAIKSNLANLRAQAEIVYDDNNSYAPLCSDANIVRAIESAKNASGIGGATTSSTSAASLTTATCHASTNGYAIAVPLKTIALYACVDSTGQSTTTDQLTASSLICGQ